MKMQTGYYPRDEKNPFEKITRQMYPTPGETVIVYESAKSLSPLTLTANGSFQTKFGLFKHDDLIQVPYGTSVSL